ncbi:hypothetical protein T484DRAFT_2578881 [Baffinella frigidus]|nr:hypothetical protein T484DRAFT_2578881 [Cryptophyta sp. CCMP2293]
MTLKYPPLQPCVGLCYRTASLFGGTTQRNFPDHTAGFEGFFGPNRATVPLPYP